MRTLPKIAILAALLTAAAAAAGHGEMEALRGQLVAADSPDTIAFKTEAGKVVELAVEGDDFQMFQDPKLQDRQWEMEGQMVDEGRFDPAHIFTLHDGQRHKVTYYCEVCHIVSYRPGRCMCCQDEVVLQETPVE